VLDVEFNSESIGHTFRVGHQPKNGTSPPKTISKTPLGPYSVDEFAIILVLIV